MSNNYKDNIIDIDGDHIDLENDKISNSNNKILVKAQGIRLNLIRKNLGYNLKDFGILCGIEPGMAGRYERGSTEIHPACVVNICLELRNQGYFISPEWILKGEGICPRIINSNSEVQIKNIEDFEKTFKESIDNKYNISNFQLNHSSSMFNGSSSIIGTPIDLSKEENFIDLNYTYCNITTDKAFIAIVSYDVERKLFIINEEGVEAPHALPLKSIKSLSIINGFWNKNISKI